MDNLGMGSSQLGAIYQELHWPSSFDKGELMALLNDENDEETERRWAKKQRTEEAEATKKKGEAPGEEAEATKKQEEEAEATKKQEEAEGKLDDVTWHLTYDPVFQSACSLRS